MTKIRYNYKLRPGKQAKQILMQEWGRNRWLWNELVANGKKVNRLNKKERGLELTKIRQQNAWLRAGANVPQQQTIREYEKALAAHFKIKGGGLPKYKTLKNSLPSLKYTLRGFSIKYKNSKNPTLRLAGGIFIPIVYSRELPNEPTSLQIYQDAVGDWWVSFVVEAPELPKHNPTGKSLGIDWGIKETATTTEDKYDYPYQGTRKQSQKQLAKTQRKMNRRYKKGAKSQSKGYMKAKHDAAKLHRKIKRQRHETNLKWVQKLIHTFDQIAIEDFKPKFMQHKRQLAQKAADAAIGQTKTLLIELCERNGVEYCLVPPEYTTQTCSNCYARTKHSLSLSERTFVCEYCGNVIPRDKNSAFLIRSLAGFNQANDKPVRLKNGMPTH